MGAILALLCGSLVGCSDSTHTTAGAPPSDSLFSQAIFPQGGLYQLLDATLAQDEVFTLQADGTVRIFDLSGAPLGTFEMQQDGVHGPTDPHNLVVNGGRIGVWDASDGRIWLFARDGRLDSSQRLLTDPSNTFPGSEYQRFPARLHGHLVGVDSGFVLELRDAAAQGRGREAAAAIVRLGGTDPDTLATLTTLSYGYPFRDGLIWVCCGRTRFHTAQPWWDFSAEGRLVWATGRDQLIRIADAHGERVLSVLQPRRVLSPADLESFLTLDYQRRFGVESEAAAGSRARRYVNSLEAVGYSLADSTPTLSGLFVDDWDRIWTRRFENATWPDGRSDTWQVFALDGRRLKVVAMPEADWVFEYSDGALLGSRWAGPDREVLLVTAIPGPVAEITAPEG